MANYMFGTIFGVIAFIMFIFALMSPTYGSGRTIIAAWTITAVFSLLSGYFITLKGDYE